MSDTVVVALISGLVGALSAIIPAYLSQRKKPSRLTTDAITLVDASGEVISNLTDEIARLEGLVEKHAGRILKLEEALLAAGVNPLSIT